MCSREEILSLTSYLRIRRFFFFIPMPITVYKSSKRCHRAFQKMIAGHKRYTPTMRKCDTRRTYFQPSPVVVVVVVAGKSGKEETPVRTYTTTDARVLFSSGLCRGRNSPRRAKNRRYDDDDVARNRERRDREMIRARRQATAGVYMHSSLHCYIPMHTYRYIHPRVRVLKPHAPIRASDFIRP